MVSLIIKGENSRFMRRFEIYYFEAKITVGLEMLALRFFFAGWLLAFPPIAHTRNSSIRTHGRRTTPNREPEHNKEGNGT